MDGHRAAWNAENRRLGGTSREVDRVVGNDSGGCRGGDGAGHRGRSSAAHRDHLRGRTSGHGHHRAL